MEKLILNDILQELVDNGIDNEVLIDELLKPNLQIIKYRVTNKYGTLLGKLYVIRPLGETKVISYVISPSYSRITYDDGYTCDIAHNKASIPPLMCGIFFESIISAQRKILPLYYSRELVVNHEDGNIITLRVDEGEQEERVQPIGIQQVSIDNILKFNDKSASTLLLDKNFITTLWDSLIVTPEMSPMVVKTKTDYLYIDKFTIAYQPDTVEAYRKEFSMPDLTIGDFIYIARPLSDMNITLPKITKLLSSHDYTRVTYDDGYVCNVWNDNDDIPALMNGMRLWPHKRDMITELIVEQTDDRKLIVKDTDEFDYDVVEKEREPTHIHTWKFD